MPRKASKPSPKSANRRGRGSENLQSLAVTGLDCFVATLLAAMVIETQARNPAARPSFQAFMTIAKRRSIGTGWRIEIADLGVRSRRTGCVWHDGKSAAIPSNQLTPHWPSAPPPRCRRSRRSRHCRRCRRRRRPRRAGRRLSESERRPAPAPAALARACSRR